jgi:hypothetical protein
MDFSSEILKEAEVLRTRLQSGSINIHEMESFLAKVVNYTPPVGRENKCKNRFEQQLENLERGYSKKPKL